MKYTVLSPSNIHRLLTARSKVRKLGHHRAAFMNLHNPRGWPEEKHVAEATEPAPLTVRSRSYEIGQALLNTAANPNRMDAVETGLPRHLLIRFQRVEAAAELKRVEREKLLAITENHFSTLMNFIKNFVGPLPEEQARSLVRKYMIASRSNFSFHSVLLEKQPLRDDEYRARREQLHSL